MQWITFPWPYCLLKGRGMRENERKASQNPKSRDHKVIFNRGFYELLEIILHLNKIDGCTFYNISRALEFFSHSKQTSIPFVDNSFFL